MSLQFLLEGDMDVVPGFPRLSIDIVPEVLDGKEDPLSLHVRVDLAV